MSFQVGRGEHHCGLHTQARKAQPRPASSEGVTCRAQQQWQWDQWVRHREAHHDQNMERQIHPPEPLETAELHSENEVVLPSGDGEQLANRVAFKHYWPSGNDTELAERLGSYRRSNILMSSNCLNIRNQKKKKKIKGITLGFPAPNWLGQVPRRQGGGRKLARAWASPIRQPQQAWLRAQHPDAESRWTAGELSRHQTTHSKGPGPST